MGFALSSTPRRPIRRYRVTTYPCVSAFFALLAGLLRRLASPGGCLNTPFSPRLPPTTWTKSPTRIFLALGPACTLLRMPFRPLHVLRVAAPAHPRRTLHTVGSPTAQPWPGRRTVAVILGRLTLSLRISQRHGRSSLMPPGTPPHIDGARPSTNSGPGVARATASSWRERLRAHRRVAFSLVPCRAQLVSLSPELPRSESLSP